MYYISYYTTDDDIRDSSPAANVKTLYIAKAIAENDVNVKILSTCTVAKNGKGCVKGRSFNICDKVVCKQYGFFITKIGLFRRLQYIFANIRLFFTLLFGAKKKQDVLFYHAVERAGVVALAKKIKKFNLILEVEEIYADVYKDEKMRKKEWKLFQLADAYIFPTNLLDEKINKENKLSLIIHGTYQVEPKRERIFNDGKIHVVYAGTLDPRKGGAIAAAAAGMFLPEKYHLHILGFGTEKDKNELLKIIDETSKQTKCTITFDGLKSGEEYIQFIQSCDIGLSTQNPNEAFNATSFPSKILSYMANGLRVVSIRIPAIEGSAIGEYMYYYDEQTPEQIAQAIMRVDIKDSHNSREIISALDKNFVKDCKELLQNA